MMGLRILQLLEKYADGTANTALLENSGARFQHQRERLAEFAHQTYTRFRLILSELEGDALVLRERDFNPNMQKMLVKVWQDLQQILKSFNTVSPYTVAQKIVEYVNSRSTRSILDNLDFLAKNHLEQTNKNLPKDFLPKIRSIPLLINLANHLEKYMKEHPLLSTFKPISQEELAKVRVNPDMGASLPETDKTVPGIPPAKKQTG